MTAVKRRWTWACSAIATVVVAAVACGAVTVTPAAASSSYGNTVLTSVACTSAGSCVAVGNYWDNAANQPQAMVVSETNGAWGAARELTLPRGAATHDSLGAELKSVACTSAGDCVAVGAYEPKVGGEEEAMVATETRGTWAPASELRLPAPALGSEQNATLNSVTCASPGSCVAVGGYETHGGYQAMVVGETAGVWGAASPVMLPAASTGRADLNSVTCTSAGNCVAAGAFDDPNANYEAIVVAETNGVWGAASELQLPTGANTITNTQNAGLDSVACTGVGNCVAVGYYTDLYGGSQASGPSAGPDNAMIASEAGGAWSRASPLSTQSPAILGSVACASPGNCVAVGSVGLPWNLTGLLVTETGGVWGQAGALGSSLSGLDSVVCTSPGN
ncbi:MAG TPA: hypothetical protein VNV42_11175, partial [Solirubrobacteraceae bacterium]|nr:hypothetical protein [Solirubrobacteraceae bacterium]